MLQTFHVRVDHRRHEQSQRLRHQEPPHHRQAQRPPGLGASTQALDPQTSDTPDQPSPEAQERALLANLTIDPVRNSRLVKISYDSPRPAEAAAVANAFANNFINMNLERRFEASSYATRFLQEQLQQARANLEDSEKRLVE